MMKALVEEVRARGLKVVTLGARTCAYVYREARFEEVGRIPMKFFREGRYIDEIVMAEILD